MRGRWYNGKNGGNIGPFMEATMGMPKTTAGYPDTHMRMLEKLMEGTKAIEVEFGPGEKGRRKAARYRFVWYHWQKALKNDGAVELWAASKGFMVRLWERDGVWGLTFMEREDDPLYDEVNKVLAEMEEGEEEREEGKFAPAPAEDALREVGFGQTENLRRGEGDE